MHSKEMLLIQANYNKAINVSLYGMLKQNDSDDFLNRPTKSKYGSINGILKHILDTEVYILSYIGKNINTEKVHDINVDFPNVDEKDLDSIFTRILEINDSYIKVLNALDDEVLEREFLNCPFQMNLPGYHYFHHVLGHATHHRGAIQYILEENNYESDFSGYLQNMNIIYK